MSILPRAIRGQSSIMYVDPEDAKRGRPRQYTVFVDEPDRPGVDRPSLRSTVERAAGE